jgi:hypothetical protein
MFCLGLGNVAGPVTQVTVTHATPDALHQLREVCFACLPRNLTLFQSVGWQGYIGRTGTLEEWRFTFTHRLHLIAWQCPPTPHGNVNLCEPELCTDSAGPDLQADAVVNELLVTHKLVTKVAQVPVVLVPVDPDHTGDGPSTRRSIAIRTFLTADFMTGVPVGDAFSFAHG